MLDKVLQRIALATIPVVGVCFLVLMFQISGVFQRLDAILTQTQTTVADVDATVKATQTTVKESNQIINDARASISEVNRNVLDERKMYEVFVPQLAAKLGIAIDAATDTMKAATKAADAGTEAAHTTAAAIQTANQTISDMQPVLAQTVTLEESIIKTTLDFDALSKSDTLAVFMTNFAKTSGDVARITADIRGKLDEYVKPMPWWKKVLVYGNATVRTAACIWARVPCTL